MSTETLPRSHPLAALGWLGLTVVVGSILPAGGVLVAFFSKRYVSPGLRVALFVLGALLTVIWLSVALPPVHHSSGYVRHQVP